jgi:hypothetical protein
VVEAKTQYADREEQARREIGCTEISPTRSRVLVFGFLLLLFTVPLFDMIRSAAPGDGAGPVRFKPLIIIRQSRENLRRIPEEGLFAANRRMLRDLRSFEELIDDSTLRRLCLGPAISVGPLCGATRRQRKYCQLRQQ